MSDVHGHGTTLSIGGSSVGEVFNISGPSKTRATVDTTHFGSPDKTREYAALRFADEGEATMDLKYNADGAADASRVLRASYKGSEPEEVIIELSNGDTFTCQGFVTALGTQTPVDDKVTQSVTIKFTGKATWT